MKKFLLKITIEVNDNIKTKDIVVMEDTMYDGFLITSKNCLEAIDNDSNETSDLKRIELVNIKRIDIYNEIKFSIAKDNFLQFLEKNNIVLDSDEKLKQCIFKYAKLFKDGQVSGSFSDVAFEINKRPSNVWEWIEANCHSEYINKLYRYISKRHTNAKLMFNNL